MGTTLDHGIYLPDEGERNCYDGLAGNWVALDNHLGSTNIHVTINDKQAWNGHVADTDIHVTTADKNRWNNQTYVFRYSSTALVASSTNSNALLDNTDNLKVGDKVIDSSGVLFSITAIDTQNSTFTIGTALIDLAQDSDVVHKSGDETVGGVKTFSNDTYITSLNFTNEVASPSSSSSSVMPIINTITYTSGDASVVARLNFRVIADGTKSLYPHENNQYALGLTSRKWKEIHATEYYYGLSDTEFSSKFVTTDTTQEISANKTFTGTQYFKDNNVQYFGIDFSKGTAPSAYTQRCMYFSPLTDGGSTYQTTNGLVGCAVGNDNVVTTFLHAIKNTAGATTRTSFVLYYDTDNDKRSVTTNGDFLPILSGQGIGNSTSKWSTINGLNPSSLGMPDLSNGIDISSYIPALDSSGNARGSYTPSVNGFIALKGIGNGCSIVQGNIGNNTSYVTDPQTSNRIVNNFLPVVKDNSVVITIRGLTSIEFIYFYPCLGNV